MADVRNRVFEFYEERPDYRIVHDNLADMKDVTTRQIYDKGAWVLHMLRDRIGDDQWWAGIRNYYRKYFNSHASTADFRFEMESVCNCDLHSFFDQWLYQGGNIRIDGTWQYNESSASVDVSLTQVQNDGFDFSIEVEVGVYLHGDTVPTIYQLTLDPNGGRTSIPVAEIPARVVLDPRTVLLAQWTLNEVAQ
jgi:aminopeptidase N